ncbi:MAG: hypothetical protein M1825_003621 [Sarcosagium campestre]|nr:MAG: hypothetical protein M1825_003621 [Sarcosagium campestre]
MTSPYLIASVVVAILAVAISGLYFSGLLDVDSPLVAPIAKYYFKAKAEAEAKALQAQGQKEGEDFVKGELKGNKQASEFAQKGLGGLKDL